MPTLAKSDHCGCGCDGVPKSGSFCQGHFSRVSEMRQALTQRNNLLLGRRRRPKVDVPCSIAGCGGVSVARVLCNRHYHSLRRKGDPLATSEFGSPEHIARRAKTLVHTCWLRNRARFARVVAPSPKVIAWAAGIYEGEGSCGLTSRTVHCTICQKDPELLHRMVKYFGGRVRTIHNGKHHEWRIAGPRSLGFLLTIYGFLTGRRQGQIRKVLAKT